MSLPPCQGVGDRRCHLVGNDGKTGCDADLVRYLTAAFAEKYDYFETADETRLTVDMDDYLLDQSLKGEFIRTVFGDGTLSDEDKAVIVRYGLRALAGEEAD